LRRKLSQSPEVPRTRGKIGTSDPIVEKFMRFCESDFGKRVMDLEAGFLRKEFRNCRKILDVGCGIGSIEERLPELDITGLDGSQAMLAEARKRSSKHFVVGDASRLPFPSGSFDAVFMVTALEFLPNYKTALDEIARVLTNRGRLVVMMLNQQSEYFKSHYAKEGDYFRNISHKDYGGIIAYASALFYLDTGYFLGISGAKVSEEGDASSAALLILRGRKR